jgi:RHS repeat-associated protein
MSSATTQGAPLAGSNFTPFGELYNPYPGGENAFFAGMLGIADSGPLTDGYQSATRFYSNLQGRWTSPDTAGLSAVDPTNPQSWNRYAYVLNNPLSGIDPLGMLNDCGGAICTPFQESSGQPGCYYSYTYYWVTGSDGILYQMPSVQLVCNGGGSSSYGPGATGGQSGGGSAVSSTLATAKCAAQFSNNHSLAAGLEAVTRGAISKDNPINAALLGSDASTVSNWITGQGNQEIPSQAIAKGVGLAARGIGTLPNPAASGLASLGNAVVRETPGGTAYAAAWTDATIATSFLGRNLGRAFVSYTIGKAAWDVSTYAYGAFVACQ